MAFDMLFDIFVLKLGKELGGLLYWLVQLPGATVRTITVSSASVHYRDKIGTP
jgi:hypothetical protein